MRLSPLLAGLLAAGLLTASLPAAAQVRADGRIVPDPQARLDPRNLPDIPIEQIPNYRQQMRDIVIELSAYARKRNPSFVILARDGLDLVIKGRREVIWEEIQDPDGSGVGLFTPEGAPDRKLVHALDGVLLDGLYCGRFKVGEETPEDARKELEAVAHALRQAGRRVLSIDYCPEAKQAAAVRKSAAKDKVLGLVAEHNRFDAVSRSQPWAVNSDIVTSVLDADNFTLSLKSDRYGSKGEWVSALAGTNHDLLVVDPFFRGREALSKSEVHQLKYKKMGPRRLLLAAVSLGVASDYRWYFKPGWQAGSPSWLDAPDPRDPADFLVRYWEPDWKTILGKTMQGIMDLGFDGVLFEDVNAYLHFEEMTPLE